MSNSKKKTDKRTMWVRIVCITLAFLMISSSLLAIFGVFE